MALAAPPTLTLTTSMSLSSGHVEVSTPAVPHTSVPLHLLFLSLEVPSALNLLKASSPIISSLERHCTPAPVFLWPLGTPCPYCLRHGRHPSVVTCSHFHVKSLSLDCELHGAWRGA